MVQFSANANNMILYSGHEEEDAHHTDCVAFMLSHEAQNALISWEAAGPRIIYASFKTKKENIKLNIIQCYVPTNDKDEETKEDFYNKLQTLRDKLKEKDMTILIGDFNTKIGSDNSGYEEVMGRQGLGKMNENGEMLLTFVHLTTRSSDAACSRIAGFIGNLGITRPQNRKSNRPYLHRTEVQKINAGCESAERGRCSLRPPSSAGQNEDEAKEERSQEEHQNAAQCGLPKGQGDNRGLPTYSQKQI
ncbi:hypothetical protein NP493_2029g00005 [Ridgeia piscesae]|uniref:Endonuclease/exonuclease/phosphatase domain-containing protein n=1 Tax=Ridgeia piscesae TaxID=27915 RepID=A0AAD9N409_RIDPI|nr:hypothetical protein NP493_2029g00005 [Ridgeia piscesae]